MSGFSIIYKNKRYTTDVSPSMTFMDIVKLFNRNPNNLRYLTMDFRNKISQVNNIQHLLNSKSWKIIPKTIKNNNSKYKVLIEIISKYDNNKYIYEFTLSRQYNKILNKPLYDKYSKKYL